MFLVSNWFVRIAVFLAIFAVLAFDGVEIAVAHVGGKDDAGNAAYAAAETWSQTHNSAQVFAAAKAAIPSHDHLLRCAATTPAAQTWDCTLTRTARTLLVGHIGFLKKYTVARETGSGTYAP